MSLPELSHEEVDRYARHLILPEVGMAGQRRLKDARVAVVGAGGLGSPLLMYLAAAGVGRIGLFDFDLVDRSNLQRQVLHDSSAVGRPKVESATRRIHEINPHVQVDGHAVALSAANALELLRPYELAVDGTDNFPTRYLINDAAVLLGIPCIYGSIFRFEGQVSVFNHAGGPTYRDLYPEPPPPGTVPSCAEGGVLGVLPGVIGCLQATETLKLLLGLPGLLSGRLLLYDALSMRFRELSLRRDPAAAPITELIDYDQFCAAPGAAASQEDPMPTAYRTIQATELSERRAGGWTPYVLDVRKPPELEIARLGFTDRVQPHERIAEIAGELPRDRDIVLLCRMGGRSGRACQALVRAGFDPQRLYNLEGGINAWAREVDPSLPTY